MLKGRYISLTKPGIIFGNLITTLGGFYLAKSQANLSLLFFTLVGISFVIASGCVFNNYIDRDIDLLMQRTKNRSSAQGLVSAKSVLGFGLILGLVGFSVLFFLTNILATLLALFGFFFYVVVYSLYFKRSSIYGTLIGSISGAIPPVVGYCAANNMLDTGAIILFLMLVFWQLPHSYAIAIYRLQDYTAAAIAILPVKKGLRYTKITMLIYVVLFALLSVLPSFFSYTGDYYLIVAIILNIYWIYLTFTGLTTKDNILWARSVFLFSIVLITLLSGMMVLN